MYEWRTENTCFTIFLDKKPTKEHLAAIREAVQNHWRGYELVECTVTVVAGQPIAKPDHGVNVNKVDTGAPNVSVSIMAGMFKDRGYQTFIL